MRSSDPRPSDAETTMCSCVGPVNMKFLGSQDQDKSAQQSKRIDRMLKREHRHDLRRHKLLLLGTGEAGKSTITKQMKIIHINGFDRGERIEKVIDIKRNIRDSIATICGAMQIIGIPLERSDNQPCYDYILSKDTHRPDFDFPQEFFLHTSKLWQDGGVQTCFRRSNEYQLLDSTQYFMDRLGEIRKRTYVPSDQDILRCRVMTNSINEIDFDVLEHGATIPFSVFDVGGQKGERRKWIQVFSDSVTAILYVVDVSSFDVKLREDETKNRLVDALENFDQVWNNPWLKNTSVLVFFNKIDQLKEKIDQQKSLNTLVEELKNEEEEMRRQGLDSSPAFQQKDYIRRLQDFSTYELKERDAKEFVEAFPKLNTMDADQTCPYATGIASRRSSSNNSKSNRNLLPCISPDYNDNMRDSSVYVSRKRTISDPGKHRQSYKDIAAEIGEEVIRTATFIKTVFMEIASRSRKPSGGANWHENHSCDYFYTCAVNTDNIQKVLEGCRGIIIKEHLRRFNIGI
ncbi:guanine nucleotide-binding protein G(s) subunit alpha [Lingula anatina]|uniref:Guanine nucleotide-binding protein G(s) subunit alpha n=1 Tax=Lingula anatina TaxID=7574 RepID=A0A1S3IJ71_LINAN|nr:guanine nucleotide-binding protein G(s) subunit alpha [Lingula anatina]|eukprot:XP_013397549.1 guanine nucleotide-binding protein G(s) subunit alpha [Lingula anatina]